MDVEELRHVWIAKRQPFVANHLERLTFIGTLRHDRLSNLYVETQLVPTFCKGDVVILDNLSRHKAPAAAEALRDIGAWFLFLPPYSPDLNPIEIAFSKLTALIRMAAARTFDQLWAAFGQVCDDFCKAECPNYLKSARYEIN
jgi:transposase